MRFDSKAFAVQINIPLSSRPELILENQPETSGTYQVIRVSGSIQLSDEPGSWSTI
jgi:hypothetical protein